MNSSPVHSTQTTIHADIQRLVQKHTTSIYQRPIPAFSQITFAEIVQTLERYMAEKEIKNLILDSCCGTGESTAFLSTQYPHSFVIGIDKSALRVRKHSSQGKQGVQSEQNYGVWRADVEDVWRLLAEWAQHKEISIEKHYILYPNPYPKAHHILRRWHGHPLFPMMLHLTPCTELRTNWQIYAEEFAEASRVLNFQATVSELVPVQPITAFERKYATSGHTLYRVEIRA